jgi:hypothetical protein
MYIGNVMLLVLNLPLVGLFVRILLVPRWVLIPSVVAIAYVAVYSATSSSFDLLAMTASACSGTSCASSLPARAGHPRRRARRLMEKTLRQALSLSDGDWSILYGSPLALVLWVLVGRVAPAAARPATAAARRPHHPPGGDPRGMTGTRSASSPRRPLEREEQLAWKLAAVADRRRRRRGDAATPRWSRWSATA